MKEATENFAEESEKKNDRYEPEIRWRVGTRDTWRVESLVGEQFCPEINIVTKRFNNSCVQTISWNAQTLLLIDISKFPHAP